jgi:hypothetical protein
MEVESSDIREGFRLISGTLYPANGTLTMAVFAASPSIRQPILQAGSLAPYATRTFAQSRASSVAVYSVPRGL